MKNMPPVVSLALMPWTLAFALGSCTPAPSALAPEPHADEAADPTLPPDVIEVPAATRRGLGLGFVPVERRRVEATLRVPGALEADPAGRREYRMAFEGRVELVVSQYEAVGAGTLLFRLQTPAWPELLHEILEGEQALETAAARIRVAEARLDEARTKLELVRGRAAARAEAGLRDAELEAEAAGLEAELPRLAAELGLARTERANAETTRAHALHRAATTSGIPEEELERPVRTPTGGELAFFRTLEWIEVRAAIPGVVERVEATDGGWVEAGGLVLSTLEPQRVRFRGRALQDDLSRLAGVAHGLLVPRSSSPADGLEARVALGLEAHPLERTITVLATPEGVADWTRPGVACLLEVVTDASAGAVLAIPRGAIVGDGLRRVFFRRSPSDPDRALRVEADLGIDDGRWVEVRSGLGPGDEVVLEGALELQLAIERRGGSAAGEGHVHADGTVHGDH